MLCYESRALPESLFHISVGIVGDAFLMVRSTGGVNVQLGSPCGCV